MYKLIKTTFTTNQLSIKKLNVKPGNFKLSPGLQRKTGKIKENVYYTALILNIKNTEEHPFPVDMYVDFRGIFEFKDIDNEESVFEFLKLQAVHVMFPYLRSIVTSLSVTAMMPPIVLPVVDVTRLFKDNKNDIFIN